MLHHHQLIKLQLEHFVSVIADVVAWATAVKDTIIHFADVFRIRLISQLIKDISRVLQILVKYFNG